MSRKDGHSVEKSEEATFEQSIARLEEIVEQLDGGELALDQSLRLFEEGIKLTRDCSRLLSEAQGTFQSGGRYVIL